MVLHIPKEYNVHVGLEELSKNIIVLYFEYFTKVGAHSHPSKTPTDQPKTKKYLDQLIQIY